jgi:hypothetical protein
MVTFPSCHSVFHFWTLGNVTDFVAYLWIACETPWSHFFPSRISTVVFLQVFTPIARRQKAVFVWYHGLPGLAFDATLCDRHCSLVAASFTYDAISNVVFVFVEVKFMAEPFFHSIWHATEREPGASFSCFIKNKGLAGPLFLIHLLAHWSAAFIFFGFNLK